MTQLTKMSLTGLAVMAISMTVFGVPFFLVSLEQAVLWAWVASLLTVLELRYNGRGLHWDEREQKILFKSNEAGNAAALMLMTYPMVIFLMGMLSSNYGIAPGRMIPITALAACVIGVFWVFSFTKGVALLIYQRCDVSSLDSKRMRRTDMLVYMLSVPMMLLIAMGGLALLRPEWTWLAESEGFAGNVQIDEWRITADDMVEARSRVTLDRWPEDTSSCLIVLPYENATVTSATFNGEEAVFYRGRHGRCRVSVPEETRFDPWPVDPTLVIEWTVPVVTLGPSGDFSNPYRARVRSLLPTHSYKLTVIAEQDSRFEMIRDRGEDLDEAKLYGRPVQWDRREVFSHARGDGGYDTDRGTCSMLITRATDRGPLVPVTCLPGTSEEQADQIARAIRRISDYPGKGAHDIPAVYVLINIGEPAIPAALDLMLSDDESTRWRAQSILWKISRSMCGLGDNQFWPAEREVERLAKKAEWEAMWERLGPLDHKALLADRERAVRLWREWLAERHTGGETD